MANPLVEDFVMDFRNAIYTADGKIDCEIDHPVHGWIPFTADPDDVEPLGAQVFAAAQASAAPYVPVPPDPAEVVAELGQAVDAYVEAVARATRYNSAAHLAGYANSTVQAWKDEAEAFILWRDNVWVSVLNWFEEVQAGTSAPPENAEALIAALPAPPWPINP